MIVCAGCRHVWKREADTASREKRGKMQESGDKALFVKQLKAMLDWYTFQAADEEYDEKNVEHILNLLDSFDPIEAEELPQRDAAWERFRRMAGEKFPEGAAQAPDFPKPHKPLARIGRFTARHKYIAAAVLLLLILTVGGTAQAIATQGSDFFFWLKQDDTGTQMIVSPEGLDGVTEQKNVCYYENREELPDWAQEWTQIADKVEMPEGYEFQYFEVNEFDNFQGIVRHYMNFMINAEILLGAWTYFDKVSYNKEEFIDYNYVRSYEADEMQMHIFNRIQENGNIYYAICFYEGNCRYLVKGQDNLEELKQLAERYLDCVQGNL